ncbi:MAG: plasmid pRiA4b ORF-3 family protein [Phycisphaerae bacterium]
MPTYFEFEASLIGVKPRAWRRFLLDADATFNDLHLAIQDACGWDDCHLHAFREKERSRPAIATNAGPDFGPGSSTVPLRSCFAKGGDRCVYVYDFGDSWMHRVRLKAVRDLPERFHRRLTGGKRAFPMEDSGSIPGYYACAAAAGAIDPDELGITETDLEERREWMDPDWHPDAFDLDATRDAFDLDEPYEPSSEAAVAAGDDALFGFPEDDDTLFGFLDDLDDEDNDLLGFDDDDLDGLPEEPDDALGVLGLLEGAIRVPAGYPIPVSVPREMRTLLLPVASGHEPVAAALRGGRPDSPMVNMTVDQVHGLLDRIADTMAEADEATRERLQSAGDRLYGATLPYVETEDIGAIGFPSEETADNPIEDLILEVENALLLHLGLIDKEELARRTGRTLATPDEAAGVRLTGPQREAILENVPLSDEMRKRLALDSPRSATVSAPLSDLAELQENLESAVENTSGNLSQKLWRALQRLRETLDAYLVLQPPSAGGNGDGA